MDYQNHRRSLFKERKEVLTSNQHSRQSRQLQEANRNKKRKDRFQCSRNISPSPTPLKVLKDKENHIVAPNGTDKPRECDEATAVKSRTAKLVITARDPEKIKKQEAFILRYLDWKDKKKAMQEKEKCEGNKKHPFVSAVSKDTGFGGKIALAPKSATVATTLNNQPSFVPKGHNEFRPPSGLKYPEEMVKEKIKSRQSIYTIVPTPPKRTKTASEFPTVKKVSNSNYNLLTSNPKKTPARINCDMADNKHTKPVSSVPKTKSVAVETLSSTKTTINSAIKPSTSRPKYNLVKAFNKASSVDKTNSPTTSATTAKPTTSVYKPKLVKMPPPSTVPAKRPPPSSRIRKTETAAQKLPAKFKSTAVTKRLETNKLPIPRQNGRKSPQQPQKNARLTQTMKAKKPTKPASGPTSTKLVSLMLNQVDSHIADIQTPRDFSNSNHFEDFVTSTKVKNSNQILEDVNGVSPIEPVAIRSSTSAKRNLLNEATMKIAQSQLSSLADKDKNKVVDNIQQIMTARRFNFVRYSEINTTTSDNDEHDKEETENDIQKIKVKCQEQQQDIRLSPVSGENITLVSDKSLLDEKTPTKQSTANDDRPVNYLSPYVSVSRGKVSLKKEKEKRNSIYLASPVSGVEQLNVSVHNNSTMVASPKSPQYSAEVRRTLEAVRYYRKQLQDEIDRLHQQCIVWETYKDENIALLQAANVDDMIDVTVGQTRLLTSKKFMQFKGLIDRCEAGATGIGDRPYDGSEATKPISSIDLEGFWSMLNLQVDNLEKRFENLNRWKCNNWLDPEEEKPKAAKPKNLSKVKKKVAAPAAKAKPNSALQQMLRKMQAEMRNKKANNMLTTTDDVILTPSKVRDRKYYSPAATVVGIPTTANRRLSVLARKDSQDSPNRRVSIGGGRRNSQETPRRFTPTATIISGTSPESTTRRATLHETVMRAQAEAAQSSFSSPKIQGRKSILKTPGSARTNLKNVLFSQKCRVKKYNFIINDGEDDNVDDPECNESTEEDLKQNAQESDQEAENGSTAACGTYSLRNRKVRLRPSCEIVIPK